jgi:hypothetical protein
MLHTREGLLLFGSAFQRKRGVMSDEVKFGLTCGEKVG